MERESKRKTDGYIIYIYIYIYLEKRERESCCSLVPYCDDEEILLAAFKNRGPNIALSLLADLYFLRGSFLS